MYGYKYILHAWSKITSKLQINETYPETVKEE